MELKKSIIALLALGTLIAVAAGVMRVTETRAQVLQRDANAIIRTCATESYHPACYDREIPKLMDHGVTMEEAFQVTALIQKQDSGYWFCHVLGHELSSKETAKDPSQWTDVVARCPVGMCSNGCLHGAFQERFRGDLVSDADLQKTIIPELSNVCENGGKRTFTRLEQGSCYHALGHLAMYVTDADVPKSLGVCDAVALKGARDDRHLCYDGVFMQIFQPLEAEDKALIASIAPKSADAADAFCATFSGKERGSCHSESWPLSSDSLKIPSGLEAFCGMGDTAESRRCIYSHVDVLVPQLNLDADKMASFCSALTDEPKRLCYAAVATRFIEIDYTLAPKSIDFCKRAERDGAGDRCWDDLLILSTYAYPYGSKDFTSFCALMPDQWSTRCLRGAGTTTPSAIQ